MFRVQRNEYGVLENYDITGTVWEGEDLKDYDGGLGCFDEGDYVVVRWIEVLKDGEWSEYHG